MAATVTPSNNRLRITPSNSPFLPRPSRSPLRGRASLDSTLSLKRVIGTTCCTPTGFDTAGSSFAYIAGGSVVVVDVDVDGENYTQRFYRARPTAVPVYSVATFAPSTPTANTTPKANDSRGRSAPAHRDSTYGGSDWGDSPSSKTWTSRERIKAATCLSLSRDGRYLAVGETGYAPRVLIFSLQESSSDVPLVAISEHAFGVQAVAWSADSKYLASLGSANDGFLYIWKIDSRTGAARLFQQNRCTSYVRDMVWMGHNLITLGVRHVKMWKIEESQSVSPTKSKFTSDLTPSTPTSQRALPGRNILLGSLLEATFTCAVVDKGRLLICTEAGDVCTLDDDDKQMKLIRVTTLGFAAATMTIRKDIAYIGGKDGSFATLDVNSAMDGCSSCILSLTHSDVGLAALGFLSDKLVTIDATQSVNIWSSDYVPGQRTEAAPPIPISGHGEPIIGVQALTRPNRLDAAFLTWGASGDVKFWDLEGRVKKTHNAGIQASPVVSAELDVANQLTCVRTSNNGNLMATADRLGILKVTDLTTDECLLDTKAHGSDCFCISLHESDSKLLMASCGRDRTTQLFHRTSSGTIEHFQTLESAAKVRQVLVCPGKVITCSLDRTMQIHDVVAREGEPDIVAAIPYKNIPLKSSPTSMTMGPGDRTIFVSLVDRTVCHFDMATGRQISAYKCLDESGAESAVIDSLNIGQWLPRDMDYLLASSNTDKSIRLYDANTGSFIDREWGHTEAINGVSLLETDDGGHRVVSVASDGTIMLWSLDLNEPSPRSMSRDPSPAKDSTFGRQTLRRVLSRAELAEFQRPSQASPAARQKSPPRTLRRRTSRMNLNAPTTSAVTPSGTPRCSPGNAPIAEDTPSRRPSVDSRQASPPPSPKGRLSRRPSLPVMQVTARKKTSTPNLRGFGTLNMSTEQASRTLRAYRKKLTSAESISAETLTELDQELRLTAVALGARSKALNDTVLSGLLDESFGRFASLLDEKYRLRPKAKGEEGASGSGEAGPRSTDGESSSSST